MKNPAPYGKGNDYMAQQHGNHDKPDQVDQEEPGNNGGRLADGHEDRGQADWQKDGSYGEAHPAGVNEAIKNV